jgi:outer membrane protein TolC
MVLTLISAMPAAVYGADSSAVTEISPVGLPAASQAPARNSAAPFAPGVTAGSNIGMKSAPAANPPAPTANSESLLAPATMPAIAHPPAALNVTASSKALPIQPVSSVSPAAAAKPSAPLNPAPQSASASANSAAQNSNLPQSWDPATTPDVSKMPTEMPELDRSHDQNSTLEMGQLRLHSASRPDEFKSVRLEISYDQSMTLAEALQYATENNLSIKISRDNLNYQRYVLYGQIANALPNFSMAYNLTHTDITNEKVKSLAKVFLTRVTYPVFQGGSVVQSILGQYYREKGWVQAYKASISDELLDVYQRYYTVLLNRTLLQIRAKAVEVSEEQFRIDKMRDQAGTGTRYSVVQSDAQLSTDKQALLQAEVTMRQSALALNFTLNYPMAVNLVPIEETISEKEIFQSNATIDDLVNLALQNRPELREYEDFRVGAGRNIQVAAAPLYPQVSLFNQYSYTNTTTSESASAASDTSGAGVFGGLFKTYQQGLALVWSLNNMGLTSIANIYAAGSLSRQARIQANQELQLVIQQVRSDYLGWRAAREQIDNAAHGVRASMVELSMAKVRLAANVTTNLEVIQAQRDYINSLTTQAQAIVNSNLAQAQLLHDTGLISTDRLLQGFKGTVR